MWRKTSVGLLVATLTLAAGTADAQKISIGYERGDSVVLAIPRNLGVTRSSGFLGTSTKRVFEVGQSRDGVPEIHDTTGGAVATWRIAGFPSLVPYQLRGVRTFTRRDKTKAVEVSLRGDLGDARIIVPIDQHQVLAAFLAPAGSADSVLRLAYDSLGTAFFTGPLEAFTPEERSLLLAWAHLTANSTRIRHERYKEMDYLVIDVPAEGNVWNDLQVTRSERVGRLLSDHFAMLKSFARLSLAHGVIGGLKLEQPTCHGTAPSYVDARCDPLEAYFPLAGLLSFAEDDITSQQLVNAAVVIVSDDRIEVDLSTQ